MSFGLKNAAQTFQRFIDQVLQGLHFTYVYINDVLIASHSPEEHLQHLRTVFHRLQQYVSSPILPNVNSGLNNSNFWDI